jgi:hypothetical protein
MDMNLFLSRILFPGIIFHELSHVVACLVLGVTIEKVKWIGKDGGYVVHQNSIPYKTIIIALIPFFFNIFISLIFARIYILNSDIIIKIISIWFAIAALFFCVPSSQDAKNVFNAIKENYSKTKFINIILNIIFIPLTIIILIISFFFKIIHNSLYFRLILIFIWLFLFIF